MIGQRTFIGVNATLRDGIVVGQDNVIGAGAVILKNTEPEQVYAVKRTPVFPKPSSQLAGL